MIQGKASLVGRQLEALWSSGTLTGMSDAQLLGRFASVRDATAESAFRELMNRHGPMVMDVCRQILRHPQDADDAFQATFLVLVRKARSIRVGESLAPWLYGVAYRTAQRARAMASRYRLATVDQLEEPMVSSAGDACHFDLRPLLHEELNRLPGKYREPIVLCHLEGKTHEEAAQLLHWPVGTVSGRLSRGRELLRVRLKRRGMEVSPALLSANWLAGTSTSVTFPLIESTVGAAIGIATPAVSSSVLSLTQGVLKAMLLNKIKMTAFIVLVVGATTAGVGAWGLQETRAPRGPSLNDPQSSPATDPINRETGPQTIVPGSPPGTKQTFVPPAQPFGPGMGMPFPPGRSKNAPKLATRGGLSTLRTESLVLVESPDRDAWQAISLEIEHPAWSKVELSPGTTAMPIASSDIAALTIKGKKIDQVAAFSPYTGAWSKQNLLQPVKEEISPLVGPGSALYQAGKDFYAFSARRGSWGVLHLEGDEEATATTSPTHIEVMQGNRLYVFSLKQGEWSKGVAAYLRPSTADTKRQVPKGAQIPSP
jgi:RNA polymerase sigma factor (sigma-70 family)